MVGPNITTVIRHSGCLNKHLVVQTMAWKSIWIKMSGKKVFYIMDTSRIFTFLTNSDFLHPSQFPNCFIHDDSGKKIWWSIQEFTSSGQFQNFYIVEHLRIYTFWTIQKFYVLDYSRISTVWTISELLQSEPFQDFYILDHSRLFGSKPIQNFQSLEHSKNSSFWTFPEFLHCWPFQNFYVLDHSQISTLWTIPEFLHSWPFHNFYVLDQAGIVKFWTIQKFLHSGLFRNFCILDHSIIFFQMSDCVRKVADSVRRSYLTNWVNDFLKICNTGQEH